MTAARYPAILDISLNVLIRAGREGHAGACHPRPVRDLDQAHLIDDEGFLSPLADRYADMWRRFLAKTPRE